MEGERYSRQFILPHDFLKILFGKLLYNFVVVSAIQQYESVIYINPFPSEPPSPPTIPPLLVITEHKTGLLVLFCNCPLINLFYTCILYYICQYIFILYMSVLLTQIISISPSPAVPTSLFSTRFISTIFLDCIYMR